MQKTAEIPQVRERCAEDSAQRRGHTIALPHCPGWHFIGAFPDHEPDDVGSWLLEYDGEAMLLEVPEGLTIADVRDCLRRIGSLRLRYVTASHDHEDHLDLGAWDALKGVFPAATFLHPSVVTGEHFLDLGGEPLWLLKAPKHSQTDVVTVFRGVDMTGDIELGMLESVNDEVPASTKRRVFPASLHESSRLICWRRRSK